MSSIYVCFNLKSDSNSFESNEAFEEIYKDVLSPLAKLLYANPEINFTLSFSGPQIKYFKRCKNEYISIIHELLDRKQIEVLGGGYYDPILPLLTNLDRVSQIDLLTGEIRQNFGKHPRGMTLFGDCWDSSIVNSCQSCGIEYVLMDSSFINPSKLCFLPLYMTELNKSIEIYPTYDDLKPNELISPENFVSQIVNKVSKLEKKNTFYQFVPDRIVNIKLNFEDFKKLKKKNFFEKLNAYLKNNEKSGVKLSTISNYRKTGKIIKCPAYVPGGISGELCKYIDSTAKVNYFTVYDFMEKYPQSRSLYNRIMFVNLLINQYKGDKIRKRTAREKMWMAQNGTGLLCTARGAFQSSKYRQEAYKTLLEAEKILREDNTFEETVTRFDYDSDGNDEYICRMNNYVSYISLISGAIQELEVVKNTGNYADNLSRQEEFEGCSDYYKRGLFVDHVIPKKNFDSYLEGLPVEDGVFSRIQYKELKFTSKRHEVLLSAEATIKPTKQKIFLRKKYIINSDGMNVQYILRNDSDKNLECTFAIETNLAHTNFDGENITYYNVEVIDNNEKIDLDSSKSTVKLNKKNKLSAVDAVRITDVESGVCFGFEPNENCSYFYSPILFKRPDFFSNKITPANMTFVSTMYWNIKLEPGKETEKTINFTITPVKKLKKGKQFS